MTSARRDGENVILTIPLSEVQALRVALQPCSCRNTKSNATTAIRERFVKGLGKAMEPKKEATK